MSIKLQIDKGIEENNSIEKNNSIEENSTKETNIIHLSGIYNLVKSVYPKYQFRDIKIYTEREYHNAVILPIEKEDLKNKIISFIKTPIVVQCIVKYEGNSYAIEAHSDKYYYINVEDKIYSVHSKEDISNDFLSIFNSIIQSISKANNKHILECIDKITVEGYQNPTE